MSDLDYIYILDVIFPKELAQKLEVEREISFGSSRDCDLAITGQGLSPIQGKFRFQNEILTYTHMSQDELIRIGNQVCKKGRMYILEKGDRITTEKKEGKEEKLKIIIRREEIQDEEYEEGHEGEEFDEDVTDPRAVEASGVFNLNEMTGVFKNPNQKGIKRLLTKTFDYTKEKIQDFFEFIREFSFAELKQKWSSNKKAGNNENDGKSSKPRSAAPVQSGKNKKRAPSAGLLPRFLGVFYNLIIFILFYFQGLPAIEELTQISFTTLSKDLFDLALPHLEKLPLKIEALPYSEAILPYLKKYLTSFEHFNLLTIFASYELLIHFILGVGLGQFLVGLRAKGNFILLRLLSPIRLLLYILTFPLLIFDLPIILNKRSLKEVLTLCSIESKSKKAVAFNSLVLLPVLILCFCNLELILNLVAGHPTVEKERVQVKKARPSDKGGEVLFKIQNPLFQLNTTGALYANEIIIPSVEQIIESNSRSYKTKLALYRSRDRAVIKISQSNILIPASELLRLLKQDPLNIGSFQKTEGQDFILSVEADEMIMEALYETITFQYQDPLPFFEKVGLVSNPYQKLYNRILEETSLATADKSAFLKGIHDNFITIERSRTNYQLSLLNVTSEGLIETRFEFEPKMRAIVLDLINKTWANGLSVEAKSSKIELLTQLPEQQAPQIILGAFSSVSSLNKIMSSKELSELEISNLTNTFLQLSYHSLKTEDQMLQTTLLEELERLDKWLLIYAKKNKKQSLSDFRLGLLRIQKALSEREESFFKLNK